MRTSGMAALCSNPSVLVMNKSACKIYMQFDVTFVVIFSLKRNKLQMILN